MQNFLKSWKFKVIIALAVLAVALMLRSAVVGNTGVFLSQAASLISQPFLKAGASFSESAGNFFKRFSDSETLYLENEDLREENRLLREQLVEYESIKRENEQFRELLKLKQNNPDYDFETASVIGRDSDNRFGSFTIDKGRNYGISVSDPVITQDGLVGIVWEVGPTYAEIKTILDISVEVGVYSVSTRDSGIITGDLSIASDGLCLFKYISKSSGISAGDTVVTSGIGGVYPKNIVVGTVQDVSIDPSGLSLTAVIKPASEIESVSEVIVIRSFEGQYKIGSETAEEGDLTE